MHVTLIAGGHRPASESTRIGHYIDAEIQKDGHTTTFLELANTDLPFWDEGMWGAEGLKDKWATLWAPISKELQKSDAFVVMAPEYHGMLPSRLKNVLLLVGNGPDLAHKPALAVGVSSSMGGTYPIAELRMNGVKNNRMVLIPDHMIVRDAANMFRDDTSKLTEQQKKVDADLRARMTFSLGQLYAYADALKSARATGKLTDKRFPNGL
jgi:NAD(P)H-dependent FMN reductase